ncbi:signal recognition particle receptor subunit beta [Zootermopsis nevadensis]|uniref:Signal recognition particle receptor subunit beta n=1 Tax=Zootermopsis nevadensis TaxID=136037 RepID=A0A067QGT4_ZOONE|nr:signal recognition particle receptor subunit beta [Zootermopsis nevadensis]KDR07565.1 Signal recognition particle receptor subunit beta [Zootermopsis nevadensis]
METPSIKSLLRLGQSINWYDPQIIGIVIAIIIVLITTVFVIWHRKKTARRSVLLMGLSDSGKTVIYSQLLHKKFVHTHTSVKENSGEYNSGNGLLRIVDVPGHERLRAKFFDEYKGVTRGIIYVIDSVTFQKDIQDVAEFLFTLLSDIVVANNSLPFLILCNKQDQTMAKGCLVIKSLVQKEMNVLRMTKSSQLESTNEAMNNNTFLGKKDKDFEFAHLLPIKVDFAESIAVNVDSEKPASLEAVEKWLIQIA